MQFIGLAQNFKVTPHAGRHIAVTGRQQDRQVGPNVPEVTREPEPVHLAWHDDVGEHEIDRVALDFAQRGLGVRDVQHIIAELFE